MNQFGGSTNSLDSTPRDWAAISIVAVGCDCVVNKESATLFYGRYSDAIYLPRSFRLGHGYSGILKQFIPGIAYLRLLLF